MREHLQLGWENVSPAESCSQRSLDYLEKLMDDHDSNVLTTSPLPTPRPWYPDSVMGDSQSLDFAPYLFPTNTESAPRQRRKRQSVCGAKKTEQAARECGEPASLEIDPCNLNSEAAILVADKFLDSIPNIEVSRIATSSFCLPIQTSRMDQDEPEQYAVKAWELCSAGARQANQYFGHTRFIRFISLCFFLIWENFSTKTGKASAREVGSVAANVCLTNH